VVGKRRRPAVPGLVPAPGGGEARLDPVGDPVVGEGTDLPEGAGLRAPVPAVRLRLDALQLLTEPVPRGAVGLPLVVALLVFAG
jgi:hypothetical protein